MNQPKLQHYVPRFVLRRFESAPDSDLIHAYDKWAGRSFLANVRNVAGENGFYDLVLDGEKVSFEGSFGPLESASAPIIAQILERQEIGFLSVADRRILAEFVIIQYFRTKQFRESIRSISVQIREALSAMDPTAATRLGFDEPTEDEVRRQSISHLKDSGKFATILQTKAWVLYEAPAGAAFWIGDSPVAMNNTINVSDVRGTIGFAVQGIEIYFPISPQYCLAFLCPSIRGLFLEAYERSMALKQERDIELVTHEAVGAAHDGFEYGFPISCVPSNVEYVNSLEVLCAERFVFSQESEFSLIQDMLRANPLAKKGPRSGVQ